MKRFIVIFLFIFISSEIICAENKTEEMESIYSASYREYNDGCICWLGNHKRRDLHGNIVHENENGSEKLIQQRFYDFTNSHESYDISYKQWAFDNHKIGSTYYLYEISKTYINESIPGALDLVNGTAGVTTYEQAVVWQYNIWKVTIKEYVPFTFSSIDKSSGNSIRRSGQYMNILEVGYARPIKSLLNFEDGLNLSISCGDINYSDIIGHVQFDYYSNQLRVALLCGGGFGVQVTEWFALYGGGGLGYDFLGDKIVWKLNGGARVIISQLSLRIDYAWCGKDDSLIGLYAGILY